MNYQAYMAEATRLAQQEDKTTSIARGSASTLHGCFFVGTVRIPLLPEDEGDAEERGPASPETEQDGPRGNDEEAGGMVPQMYDPEGMHMHWRQQEMDSRGLPVCVSLRGSS